MVDPKARPSARANPRRRGPAHPLPANRDEAAAAPLSDAPLVDMAARPPRDAGSGGKGEAAPNAARRRAAADAASADGRGGEGRTGKTTRAAGARRAKSAQRTRRSGAVDLLLGWARDEDPSRAVGFAGPRARTEDGEAAPIIAEPEGHLVTVAPTGAGKGRGVIIPNLLRYQGPVIVVDPKGENYRVTARARREMGHTVHVLDPFGVTGERGDTLNPLDVLSRPGVERESEARALAHLLSGGALNLKEPFWDIWGRALLAGVIDYVCRREPPDQRHFGRVRALLKNDDVVYNLAKALDDNPDLEGLGRTEIAAFLQLVEQTRSGVLATAQSYTDLVNCGPAQAVLRETTIDLDAVADGSPLTIYLVLPPDKLASHGALMRVWIGALVKVLLSRQTRPEHDTLLIVDECAQLGPMEDLRVAMTLLRGYGLRVWAFFQDLSQLRRQYPDDWQTIINNAAVFQTFGVTNHVMATELSEMLGDVDAFALRSLPREAQVVARARMPARICSLPDYLQDAVFARRFDPNPMFAGRVAAPRRAD